ncbi:MAG TPA: hypothetical protein VL463_10055 [Kofleriaceae bacterium]|nr:hypothetical protein [Kofleriaceae bacterium]
MKLAIAWIGSIALAVYAGRALAPATAPAAPIVVSSAPAPAPALARPIIVASPSSSSGLTADDVRAAVRAELAARGDDTPAPAPAPASDPSALARALELIAAADANGVWTDRDRDALRAIPLDGAQHAQVMQTLFPLINGDRVRVETSGALL